MALSCMSSTCKPILGARSSRVKTLKPVVTRRAVVPNATKTSKTVVPSPSFNLPLGLLAMTGIELAADLTGLAAVTAILGTFLAIQATRIRFVFDEEGLEVAQVADMDKETENAFVGGANRWSFDKFVNWELWWPGFPVLTYFKETQTKPEGQIHFFPVIFNGKELYDVMVERCGPSATSGPKE